jgi:internalin A
MKYSRMPVIKEASALLGLLISFTPVLPVIAAQSQPVKTKSFTEWCQSRMSVAFETRKTIDLLLKRAETNDCQIANSKLRKLTSLNLKANEISDVRPLASLPNLTDLDLSSNKISDVKPLATLTNLTFLNLGFTAISDVKPLTSLTNLIGLYLKANQITEKLCPIKPESICRF